MTDHSRFFHKAGCFAVPAAALAFAIAAVVGAPQGQAADGQQDRIKGFPNAANSDYVPRKRVAGCAQRYGDAARLGIDPGDTGQPLDKAIEQAKLGRVWGVEKNASITSSPDGAAMEVVYPKGSYSPGADDAPRGGAGFVAEFGAGDGLERACLTYNVRFQDDFYFKKGGKLPGLYGGNAPTGGDEVTGTNGFSARLMWRSLGAGEAYAYVVNKPDDYGLSIGRGAWQFQPGAWQAIQMEVVLNDPGRANGRLRVWVDGRQVIDKGQLVYRTDRGVKIDGLIFQTFFGGGDKSWASPKDQSAAFSDFKIYQPQRGEG
ncbi:polysaccharide lyase [Rhodovibrio salinarum]|uniref:Polysaccharide lyase 14 domain-containing protein n=1 Tax=Rhodovibrio salinarum TaxID=1087 RepID=A0A934QFQ8_9PROT|nr:hypothetical protein [Rhodovibrio salinarum]MBK1696158.1 hypothetical protein [Rhodovibrio salinarum]